MKETDFKKLEELFNNDLKMDNSIWALSILMLLFMNRPETEQPIINIYLGDD